MLITFESKYFFVFFDSLRLHLLQKPQPLMKENGEKGGQGHMGRCAKAHFLWHMNCYIAPLVHSANL